MAAGQTYAMSAAVYQLSGEPVEMKFSLQYTGSDGQPAYDKIALETVESGSGQCSPMRNIRFRTVLPIL